MFEAQEALFSHAAMGELIETVISRGAKFRLTVKGCSMAPFIKDRDVVTVSALPGGKFYGFGKNVAFFYPGKKMLGIHRIIGRQGDRYLIKGDNSRQPDGLIPKENILGYVTKVQRNNKNVLLGLGPERFMIAFLSRLGLLRYFFWLARLIRSSAGRSPLCRQAAF
jgi:signal peptidase I